MKKIVVHFMLLIGLVLFVTGCGEEGTVERIENENGGSTNESVADPDSDVTDEVNWLDGKTILSEGEQMVRSFVEEFFVADATSRETAIEQYIHPEVQDFFYLISGFSEDSDFTSVNMDLFAIIETVEYEEDGEMGIITLTREQNDEGEILERIYFLYEEKISWFFSPTAEDEEMRQTYYDMRELFSADTPPEDILVAYDPNSVDVSEEEKPEDSGNEIGTRSNPLSIGERVSIDYYDFFHGQVSMEIEMLEVISGKEAWEMVRAGNMFNDAPGEDQEYILAKFYVKVNEMEEEPFDLYHALFDAVSTSGNTYDEFLSVSGLSPDLGNELYEGAEREGYTYFLVDKDDEAPLVAFQRRTDAEVWFELR